MYVRIFYIQNRKSNKFRKHSRYVVDVVDVVGLLLTFLRASWQDNNTIYDMTTENWNG